MIYAHARPIYVHARVIYVHVRVIYVQGLSVDLLPARSQVAVFDEVGDFGQR